MFNCCVTGETNASYEPDPHPAALKLFILKKKKKKKKQEYHNATKVMNYCLCRRRFKSAGRDLALVLNCVSV